MKTKQTFSHFLRFEKQCSHVATEAGFFNSDILGIDKKNRLLEFEIKTSWSDFLADFKKPKHELYSGQEPEIYKAGWEGNKPFLDENGMYTRKTSPRYLECIPWKFYFVVTPDLQDKCLAYLEEKSLPYGLYLHNTELIRKSKVIKDQFATQRIKDVMALRMSSEIVGMRESLISERESNTWLKNKLSQLESELNGLQPMTGYTEL